MLFVVSRNISCELDIKKVFWLAFYWNMPLGRLCNSWVTYVILHLRGMMRVTLVRCEILRVVIGRLRAEPRSLGDMLSDITRVKISLRWKFQTLELCINLIICVVMNYSSEMAGSLRLNLRDSDAPRYRCCSAIPVNTWQSTAYAGRTRTRPDYIPKH